MTFLLPRLRGLELRLDRLHSRCHNLLARGIRENVTNWKQEENAAASEPATANPLANGNTSGDGRWCGLFDRLP
jgi:hypothetical protein